MICPFMSKPVITYHSTSGDYDNELLEVECKGKSCALWMAQQKDDESCCAFSEIAFWSSQTKSISF